MTDLLQEILSNAVLAILVIILGIITAALVQLRPIIINQLIPQAIAWMEAHFGEKTAKIIREFAEQSYALAEKKYGGQAGEQKMAYAIDYASKVLMKKGINISPKEIMGAVEKAHLDYKTGIAIQKVEPKE